MRCLRCGEEPKYEVHGFQGMMTLDCACGRTMIPILGVEEHGRAEASGNPVAGVEADSSSGGEAVGRDDSVAPPEGASEVAAEDEGEVASAAADQEVIDGSTVS